MRDLEITGLDETMVLTPGLLKQATNKAFLRDNVNVLDKIEESKNEIDDNDAVKLMSLASLQNDDSIFFLHGAEVKKMDITNGP